MYKATVPLFPVSGKSLGSSSRELRLRGLASWLNATLLFTRHRYLQLLTSHLGPLFYRKDLSLGGASRIRGGMGQGKRFQFFSHCPLPCSRTIVWAALSIRGCYTTEDTVAELTKVQPACPVPGLWSLPCWAPSCLPGKATAQPSWPCQGRTDAMCIPGSPGAQPAISK